MENITFSSEVIAILDHVAQQVGIVIDWSSDNIVPYATDIMERYVSYNILINMIWLTMWVLLLAVVITGWSIFKKKINDTETLGFVAMVILTSLLVISFGVISIEVIPDLIKWIYVPEILLLEEIQLLIEGAM